MRTSRTCLSRGRYHGGPLQAPPMTRYHCREDLYRHPPAWTFTGTHAECCCLCGGQHSSRAAFAGVRLPTLALEGCVKLRVVLMQVSATCASLADIGSSQDRTSSRTCVLDNLTLGNLQMGLLHSFLLRRGRSQDRTSSRTSSSCRRPKDIIDLSRAKSFDWGVCASTSSSLSRDGCC